MEEYVLKCLDNIKFNENNILNAAIFTCKDKLQNRNPCQNCLSCKLSILMNFSLSLLNHMPNSAVYIFIKDCTKYSIPSELSNILCRLLSPLKSKDRLYSLSRTMPSLNTDLMDLSMKNFTVNPIQIDFMTKRISDWIAQQPESFRLQFIFFLLSHLKLAVLSEIYRLICYEGSDNLLHNKETQLNKLNTVINDPDLLLQDIADSNYKNLNGEVIQTEKEEDKCRLDLITILPIHISLNIINMLDEKSLKICSTLCESWRQIVNQVRKEFIVNEKIKEQAMQLQSQEDGVKSVSTTPADPTFARDTDVPIPRLDPDTHAIMYIGDPDVSRKQRRTSYIGDIANEETDHPSLRKSCNMNKAYKNIITKNVIIEERNIFCGSYSIMLIMESLPRNRAIMRTISYNGGQFVAVGGTNKIIQFLDVKGNQVDLMKNRIHGHAGSINVVRIINKPEKIISSKKSTDVNINIKDAEVLSGSYDTTIRRWSSVSGKCLKIYIGHSSTVTSLDTGEDQFISGSLDGTCKLWRYDEKQCLATMRHRYPVTAVAISVKICVSGDSSGLIKVWNVSDGKHIKNLNGHNKEISTIKIDNFHIMSSSHDCSAMLWSTVGKFHSCLGNFRHPKPILCMEFQFLRAITGCEDGRIRIWNVLNGQCIRIIRGNSSSDPILTLIAKGDLIVINTISNILVLYFEPINWVYQTEINKNRNVNSKIYQLKNQHIKSEHIIKTCKHANQRCERSRFAGNMDPRIFLTPTTNNLKMSTDKNNNKYQYHFLRSFEDGTPLIRSSTWIISPSLNKTLQISKEIQRIPEETAICSSVEEKKIPERERPNLITRSQTESTSCRRISYGFESQNHLICDVELDEMKDTLRKHMRSQPHESAEAMPDFIKTMIAQMKTSTATGRPVSAFSSNYPIRPSSGPSKVDSKSKLPIEEIKNVFTPISQYLSTPMQENFKIENDSNNSSRQPIVNKIVQEAFATSNIKTSSTHASNQSVVGSFFVPPDFRQKLHQRKVEFDNQHKYSTSNNKLINTSNIVSPKNSKEIKVKPFFNDLKLQTYENAQLHLNSLEKSYQDYELKQKKEAENEHYQRWIKKATECPNIKYEKDILRNRPRSAKM